MRNVLRVFLVLIFPFLCGFILMAWADGGYCQDKTAATPADIRKVFDATRIKEARYRLVIYNQDAGIVSNVKILDRQISRENYETKPSIKITEILTEGGSTTTTTVFVDSRTLMPVYFENSSNGTVTQKANFDHGKEIIVNMENGVEKRSETDLSASVFLSNCFSELIQANDFSKNPIVQFETVNPGNSSNQFIAESLCKYP